MILFPKLICMSYMIKYIKTHNYNKLVILKMSESTNSQPGIQSLIEIYQAGYAKSVIAMTNDIIAEYKIRLEHGTKKFMYCKKWQSVGYFMSPVYTEGKMEPTHNTIFQSETDITKFKVDVCKQLIDQYGIFIHRFDTHYVENGYNWHHLKFDIVLSLDASESDK